jgi:hypothetical protein
MAESTFVLVVPFKRGMRRRQFFSGNSENKNAICIRSRQDYPGNKEFLTRATPGEVAAELTNSEPAILGVETKSQRYADKSVGAMARG